MSNAGPGLQARFALAGLVPPPAQSTNRTTSIDFYAFAGLASPRFTLNATNGDTAMIYLLSEKMIHVESHPAETFRAILGPAADTFEAVRLLEFMLSAAPDDGTVEDGMRVNSLRLALVAAYGEFVAQAFESAAAEFLLTVKARAADGDELAAVALPRFERDKLRHLATIRSNTLASMASGPARAAFQAANKLRALRTNIAKLHSAGSIALADVLRTSHLSSEASYSKRPDLTAADVRRRVESCAYISGHAAFRPVVHETLDALDARGIAPVSDPRARKPLAERRAYMRDYMKAYRERRKAAGTANVTPPAEVIDPLS